MSSAPVAPVNVEEVLGAAFIGGCLSLVLFGLSTAQTYIYAVSSKGDSKAFRSVVYAVWCLEALHVIFCLHALYHYAVDSFSHPELLRIITWSTAAGLFAGLLVIVLAQGFYIYRIWIMSKRSIKFVVMPIILLVSRTAFGFGSVALLCQVKTWPAFHTQLRSLVTTTFGLSLSVIADVTTSGILLVLLRRGKEEATFKRTRDIIGIYAIYVLNTGALTAIFTSLELITFFSLQRSLTFVGFFGVAGKLYANALLGTLNGRQLLHKRNGSLAMQSPQRTPLPTSPNQSHQLKHIEIFQQVSKSTKQDDGCTVASFDDSKVVAITKDSTMDGNDLV